MTETAQLKGTREGSGPSALVGLILSIVLLIPLVGQLFACFFWAYATRSGFDPLYQD